MCNDYDEATNQKLLGWQFLQYVAAMHGADVIFDESVEKGLELCLYLPVLDKAYWIGKDNVEIVGTPSYEENTNVFDEIVINGKAEQGISTDEEEMVLETDSEKVKLLVIEDNADIRLYMKVMFPNFTM